MVPGPDGTANVVSAGGANVTAAGNGNTAGTFPGTQVTQEGAGMINNLVAKAYGARLAQRRAPDEE